MKMTAATAAKRQIKLATTMKIRATTTMMPMTAITMSITRAGKAAPSPNAGGGISPPGKKSPQTVESGFDSPASLQATSKKR